MFRIASFSRFYLRTLLVGVLGLVLVGSVADAKTKRIDNKIVRIAETLSKDREASFAREEAMPVADFQEQWTALAKLIDESYKDHTVVLKTFGNDIKTRKVFTHLMYMALRVNQKAPLSPSPEEFISRHGFLQELTVDGACYTGGDTFPKKMKDLLKPRLAIQVALRNHLDAWDSKYRKKFEKEFGKSE